MPPLSLFLKKVTLLFPYYHNIFPKTTRKDNSFAKRIVLSSFFYLYFYLYFYTAGCIIADQDPASANTYNHSAKYPAYDLYGLSFTDIILPDLFHSLRHSGHPLDRVAFPAFVSFNDCIYSPHSIYHIAISNYPLSVGGYSQSALG